MSNGQGMLSWNKVDDDNEKVAAMRQSSDQEIDEEIPAQSTLTLSSRPRLSRWLDKFRNPTRMTLPRTDKETVLTSTNEPDPTSF